MRRLFQDFDGGDYDRPNEPYVCGSAEEGRPCPFGPTKGGRCPRLAECEPVKQGDRWRCNRPATRGGPCDAEPGGGPTAEGRCPHVGSCRPRPSLRTRRARFALGAALFLMGLVAMLLASPWKADALAPGPLTRAHAQLITRDKWQARCAACHPRTGEAVVTLAAATLTGAGHGEPSQSALCMECHRADLNAAHALDPHGVDPATLREGGDRRHVACAACHQEHHGALHDLTALSNDRCQACHQQRYESFAADHPDFAAWPYERRTRIVFDHAGHESKHFPAQKAAFACAACHAEGAPGEPMQTLGFDAACAACHEAGIRQSGAEGLPLVTLPMLDTDALREAGQDVGPWPEAATGDFDGDLAPFARLLLEADPQAREALRRLGPGFTFFDVDPDDPEVLADAAVVARALKTLIEDLAERGHAAIDQRAAGVAGHAGGLSGGLPVEIVDAARRRWFDGGADTPNRATLQTDGGWFADDASYSLRYAPVGHADPVLRAWLDLALRLGPEHKEAREAALEGLASSTSPGRCVACHSIDRDAAGGLSINWHGAGAVASGRPFTRFDHGPHLTQAELSDCRSCHAYAPGADPGAAYATRDPLATVSGFASLSKRQCAECHRPHAAGDACTQCHHYHAAGAPAER